MGIVACAALLAISASSASAEGGHGGGTTKNVEKWVKARALEVAQDQGPVFPNAEVTKRGSFAACSAKHSLQGKRKDAFTCFFNIYINEYELGASSVIDPPQRTFRVCKNYSVEKPRLDAPLRIKRSAGGKISIKGGWKQSCELDEFAFELWAVFGPPCHPDVTMATPHETGEIAVEELTEPRDDLLPAGADPGPAPGPLGTGAPAARSDKSGKKPRPAYAHTFCSNPSWVKFPNGWYAIYGCLWDEPNLNGLFGATPNLYAQNQWIEFYYYANTGYYVLYQRAGTSVAARRPPATTGPPAAPHPLTPSTPNRQVRWATDVR